MAESPVPTATGERQLIYCLLGLRLHLIDHDILIQVFEDWRDSSGESFGQALIREGGISEADHALLEHAVERHLIRYEGNVEKSLAELRLNQPTLFEKEVASVIPRDDIATPPGKPQKVGRLRLPNRTSRSLNRQRYKIVRTIDVTDNSETAIAEDLELRREVALKQVSEARAKNLDVWHRLTREADVLSSLEHPSILPVYSYGTREDGRPYFTTRYVRGNSLQEAIRQFHGPPDFQSTKARQPITGLRAWRLRELLRRFSIVCQTVAYAHNRGIVHRDLKPANILLGQFGETLVVEWGLAKVMYESVVRQRGVEGDEERAAAVAESITSPGELVGTLEYISPEQAQGNQLLVGPLSDVFSLGAVLYAILVGRPPYNPDDRNLQAIVREGRFVPPRHIDPSIDPRLEAICLKAMAKTQRDRYRSAQDLSDDIERWLADESLQVSGPTLIRIQRWLKQKATLIACFGGVFLFAAGAFAARIVWLESQLDREQKARIADLIALDRGPRPHVPVVDLVPSTIPFNSSNVAQKSHAENTNQTKPIKSETTDVTKKTSATVQNTTTPPEQKPSRKSEQPDTSPKKPSHETTPSVVTKPGSSLPVVADHSQKPPKTMANPILPVLPANFGKAAPQPTPTPSSQSFLDEAQSLVAKGNTLARQGKHAEAVAQFAAAESFFEKAGPRGTKSLDRLESLVAWTEAHIALGKEPEASQRVQQARALLDQWNISHDDKKWAVLKARFLTAQADVYHLQTNRVLELQSRKQAAEAWSRLDRSQMPMGEILARSGTQWQAAIALAEQFNQPAEIRDIATKAIEFFEKIVGPSGLPSIAQTDRERFAAVYLKRGELLVQRKLHTPAIVDLGKAISIGDDRTQSHARFLRAHGYLGQKNWKEAREDAQWLAMSADTDAWFGAAQIFARLATSDRKSTTDEADAIRQLERMKQKGTVTPAQIKSLERTSPFAGLRSKPAFKKLLSE